MLDDVPLDSDIFTGTKNWRTLKEEDEGRTIETLSQTSKIVLIIITDYYTDHCVKVVETYLYTFVIKQINCLNT